MDSSGQSMCMNNIDWCCIHKDVSISIHFTLAAVVVDADDYEKYLCVYVCREKWSFTWDPTEGKGKTNYAVVCFESPKDKYMGFNFSMRKPISGTVRITIWNLIRLSSATAINTFIAFILLGLGAFFLSFSLNLSPLFQHRGLNTYSYMAAVRLWHGFGSFQYNICQQLFLKHKAMDSKEYSRFFFPLEFFSLKWTMCCDVERSIQYGTRPQW